jgi:hypothetical protein
MRKEHNIPLEYIAIDWHEMDKQLGSHGIVEAFWQSVSGKQGRMRGGFCYCLVSNLI